MILIASYIDLLLHKNGFNERGCLISTNCHIEHLSNESCEVRNVVLFTGNGLRLRSG